MDKLADNIFFNIKKQLDEFTIDVKYGFNGGTLVIEGESGAGKTTILNCISGILDPQEGWIKIGSSTVFNSEEKTNLPARNRNIGYVFQNYALFPNMTVSENIVYGIKNMADYKDRQKKRELLEYSEYIMETFGISHLKSKYPKNISGGEKQRVALSRAIVKRPNLLLLDEPFSALDNKTKDIIYSEFFSFKETFKIPTILITHNKKESDMFADQKITLNEGKIVG